MSAAVSSPRDRPSAGALARDILHRACADAPVYAALAILLTAAMAPTLVAAALDPRIVEGVGIWVKPLKFEIALALYAGTLAVFSRFVSLRVRAARRYRAFVAIVAAAILYENVWIAGAAAAGTVSQFDVATPLMGNLYTLAGVGAVTLTAASLVLGIAIAANRETELPPAMKLSIVLGLVPTFFAIVPVAGRLSAQGSHFVAGAAGMPTGSWPLVGWATDHGDLRVAHFFATHALHALSLLGLAVVATLGRERGSGAVWLASALYAALVVYAFLEAVAGRPFLSAVLG